MVRDKKNPYSIKDNSILLSLKHSMMLDRTQIKNLFNHEEESFFEENVNDEGISNILYFKCDIDKLLDLIEEYKSFKATLVGLNHSSQEKNTL